VSTSDATTGEAKAVANIMPFSTGTIRGTATFTQSGSNVTLVVALTNCPQGVHPMHIHQGSSCASVDTQGMHWDSPRGDNIGSGTGQITCLADSTAMLTYTRMGTDPKPWTVGGLAASDVVGHVLVVHGINNTDQRHGCGEIMRQ
jgi:Cu/Zn superoxide dismutase